MVQENEVNEAPTIPSFPEGSPLSIRERWGRDRSSVPLDEADYRRGFSSPKQHLYNPNTDTANNAKGVCKEERYGYANPTVGICPTRRTCSFDHGFLLSQSEEHRKDDILVQSETSPIPHKSLVAEAKGIYSRLVIVKARCIDIDERQSAAAQDRDPWKRPKLENDQWQSLVALHKQLLHEHHDFFLASQHLSAIVPLGRLAAKYWMPARIWRQGIRAFLEVLQHKLPESPGHMLTFIYIVYSMMALLYKGVSGIQGHLDRMPRRLSPLPHSYRG